MFKPPTNGYRGKAVRLDSSKKNRKPSSSLWLRRQLNDPYVVKAKLEGYRSRAAYKLIEINNKFKILKPNNIIVDLGAAPGGWTQVAAQIIGSKGNIIAIDLLEMEPLPGVQFIQKDFYDADAAQAITHLAQDQVDVVLSDMAPSATGHQATDHLKIIDLCEKSFEFAIQILKPGGHFVAKILKGGTENSILNKIKLHFKTVKHIKPPSSRKESSELYIVALSKR